MPPKALPKQVPLGLFPTALTRPDPPWSDEQRAVIASVSRATAMSAAGRQPRHKVIRSVAGSSKTTILVKLLNSLPPNMPALMLAYNRSVRIHLASLAPPNVRVETFHSYGLKVMGSYWGRVHPTPGRDRELLDASMPRGLPLVTRKVARKLLELSRADMAVNESDVLRTLSERSPWIRPKHQPDEPPPPILPPGYGTADLAHWVVTAIRASHTATQGLSWDDMCYLPVALGMAHGEYGFVGVDEFQDLTVAQMQFAMGAIRPNGLLVAAGDPKQSVYAFRGADPRSMDRFVGITGAEEHAMTCSFRCAEAIAEVARQFVPDFRARPGAPAGLVRQIGWDEALREIVANPSPDVMVLSRSNAPLMGIALALWRAGVRATIQGREFAAELRRLTAAAEHDAASEAHGVAPPIPIRDLLAWLRRYTSAEGAKFDEDDPDDESHAEALDLALSLESLSNGLLNTGELKKRIAAIFEDGAGLSTLLSSVHRAKGLERRKVYVIRDTFLTSNDDPLLREEERNLLYVAVTRAAEELVFVFGRPG